MLEPFFRKSISGARQEGFWEKPRAGPCWEGCSGGKGQPVGALRQPCLLYRRLPTCGGGESRVAFRLHEAFFPPHPAQVGDLRYGRHGCLRYASDRRKKSHPMSATDLIEQLKALPSREREAFARLFRESEKPTVQTAGNGNGASAPGSGNWPDFGARLKRIYGNKAADSEAVTSYARGDW